MHTPDIQAEQIVSYIDQLRAFAHTQLADKELAADAVQEAVTKAVKNIHKLRDEDKLLSWLYVILRNTIRDLARKQSRELTVEEFPEEIYFEMNDADKDLVCSCFKPLISTLPSDYGRLVQAVELDGTPRETVATEMGITVLNLNVKLHRAREKLREAIENTCLMCAKHGCLNCTCS